MKQLSVLLIILTLFGCGDTEQKDAQNKASELNVFSDPKLIEIHDQKDFRNATWLIQELTKEEQKYTIPILDALASTKDSLAFSAVLNIIKTPDLDSSTYSAAINALGNLCPMDSAEVLLSISQNAADPNIKNGLYEVIGKRGGKKGYELLLDLEPTEGTIAGLYNSLLSKYSNVEIVETAVDALTADNNNTRFWAAHILLRQRENDLSAYEGQMILAYNKEKDTYVKIALAGAFKKSVGQLKTDFIKKELQSDIPDLIKVNLLKSLSETDFPDCYKIVMTFLSESNYQLASTAVHYLKNNYNEILDDNLALISNKDPLINAEILGLKAMKKVNRSVVSDIKEAFNSSKNDYEKMALIAALPDNRLVASFLDKIMQNDGNQLLQGKAHEKLLAIDLPPKEKIRYIEKGFASDNNALICQSGFSAREFVDTEKGMNWIRLMKDKQSSLSIPLETEAFVTLQNTIEIFQKKTETSHTPKFNHPIDWLTVSKIPNRPKIEVKTSKGTIIWELYLDKIPGAVSSIVQLVDSGFYDGKHFHRVVPNFVAQGGCPRGDGWGSLNYTSRSEYADGVRYTEGSVGLASVGEDTESCQFFMCHSPTPHLNNRYTIIGHVTMGMEVLNELAVGDRIVSMRRVN